MFSEGCLVRVRGVTGEGGGVPSEGVRCDW